MLPFYSSNACSFLLAEVMVIVVRGNFSTCHTSSTAITTQKLMCSYQAEKPWDLVALGMIHCRYSTICVAFWRYHLSQRPWRDFSVHTGDIQKLPGHSPGQLALRSPAWAREAVGQDNLQGLEDMEKGKVLNGVFASSCPGKLCSQASLAPEPRTELGEQGYCEKPWQVE